MEGKVALVTGAASGIGRAAAQLFAEKGCKVIVSDITQSKGEETVDLIRKSGGEATFVRADVSKGDDVENLIAKTVEIYGQLDYAFNNAGIPGPIKSIAEFTDEEWYSRIDVNLNGVFLCLKYEIRQMRKQGTGGAIVNASSAAGLLGPPSNHAYTAAKHGVIGLTRSAALECAKENIRINAICPGLTETGMHDGPEGQEAKKFLITLQPNGRIASPMEIAETAVWLCSDAASFVLGAYLAVDGGVTASL